MALIIKKKGPTTGRWSEGTSGNPAGRPVGSRNRSTLLLEAMLDGQAEALANKAIELALKGEPAALRLCLERICPPRRERPIDLPLPKITDPQHSSAALGLILEAAAQGQISTDQAARLSRIVEAQIMAIEAEVLIQRVSTLEEMLTQAPPYIRRTIALTATRPEPTKQEPGPETAGSSSKPGE